MIPSELKGNSKGSALASISVESRGLYPPADSPKVPTAWRGALPHVALSHWFGQPVGRNDDAGRRFSRYIHQKPAPIIRHLVTCPAFGFFETNSE